VLAVLLALLAHDEGSSSSEVRIEGGEVVWAVELGTLGLARVMDLGAPPHRLREEDLLPHRERIARFVRSGLSVRIDGKEAEGEAGALEALYEEIPPTDVRVLSRVRQVFRFRTGEAPGRVTLGYRVFCDLVPNHRAVMTVAWAGRTREFVLRGASELKLRPETLDERWWAPIPSFIGWGIHHIFLGFDHLAFLFALLLGARTAGSILGIVTSFTAAHSLTLLLAALEIVRIPSRITEALIALSILYVAVENFFLREGRHRWILTFAFGLVHGLGFSGTLRDLLTDRIVVPVLAFNVGIELGQLAILASAFPVLRILQRASGSSAVSPRRPSRLALAGSVPLFLLGLGWLVERACGLSFMPL
jgi:hydrogenase/urease accessory protein HupE